MVPLFTGGRQEKGVCALDVRASWENRSMGPAFRTPTQRLGRPPTGAARPQNRMSVSVGGGVECCVPYGSAEQTLLLGMTWKVHPEALALHPTAPATAAHFPIPEPVLLWFPSPCLRAVGQPESLEADRSLCVAVRKAFIHNTCPPGPGVSPCTNVQLPLSRSWS